MANCIEVMGTLESLIFSEFTFNNVSSAVDVIQDAYTP